MEGLVDIRFDVVVGWSARPTNTNIKPFRRLVGCGGLLVDHHILPTNLLRNLGMKTKNEKLKNSKILSFSFLIFRFHSAFRKTV